MPHSKLITTFSQLNKLLLEQQALWRPQPFTCNELPWSTTHAPLHTALLALDDNEVQVLHDQPQQRIAWFRCFEPALCESLTTFEAPLALIQRPLTLSRFDAVGIPERKWQQIIAFTAALAPNTYPVVDWCAGKGHLSRIVQRSQQQVVHCLEWDSALVTAGAALAKKQQLDIHYHQHDVMQTLPAHCHQPDNFHIGLHVCGELHAQLLRHVTNSQAQAVALSPCCYHKISSREYQPLSHTARQSSLTLSRAELHLAVQDSVTAHQAERRLLEQERLWRLGFDALQRVVCASDEYLPIPSVKNAVLRQGFPAFCRWAAKTRQLTLPDKTDFDVYLQTGREKYRQVVRLELLRRLFNRPLELWLALDRALYLQEHGYQVSISRFCDYHTSPRNVLIQGQRI
jgi:hypothetical protein